MSKAGAAAALAALVAADLPVAEYTVAMTLLANKRVLERARDYRAARSRDNWLRVDRSVGNYRKTVGICSASLIGRRVIELLYEEDRPAEEVLAWAIRTFRPRIALASSFGVEDVALIDIGLPHLDGYQVAQRIRRREHLDDVFLVALSGYGAPGDVTAAREAGFDGVELHYAHAYTMSSFLSRLNDRHDGYGGPREHRVRRGVPERDAQVA